MKYKEYISRLVVYAQQMLKYVWVNHFAKRKTIRDSRMQSDTHPAQAIAAIILASVMLVGLGALIKHKIDAATADKCPCCGQKVRGVRGD